MKFGKLEDISKVDFRLPKDNLFNQKLLEELEAVESPEVYIGCTSWSTKEWKGKYYPKKIKPTEFLIEYSKQFNTIELNTTHYGTPNVETLERWHEQSSDDFIFCPKIHKAISHRKTLGMDSDIIENTIHKLSLLKEKLGPCFIQLPPYYDSSRIAQLEKFLEIFPSYADLAVELRHHSWFEDQSLLDDLQAMVTNYGKTLLITDVAGRRDVAHMRLCGTYLMVRFVGNDLHASDFTRIDEWVTRIKKYTDNGVQKIYFFPHEPDNILAPDLAVYLCAQIEEKCKVVTRGPKLMTTDAQLKLF